MQVVIERRERLYCSESGQLSLEFEHARASTGWAPFPFTRLRGGVPLPIALERIHLRERMCFFLGL